MIMLYYRNSSIFHLFYLTWLDCHVNEFCTKCMIFIVNFLADIDKVAIM